MSDVYFCQPPKKKRDSDSGISSPFSFCPSFSLQFYEKRECLTVLLRSIRCASQSIFSNFDYLYILMHSLRSAGMRVPLHQIEFRIRICLCWLMQRYAYGCSTMCVRRICLSSFSSFFSLQNPTAQTKTFTIPNGIYMINFSMDFSPDKELFRTKWI